MISYGFSMAGTAHVAKGVCCQDSHKISVTKNGIYVGAVADGVGSAENSQIGSKIAAETAVNACVELMPIDYDEICIRSMIRVAFNYAFKKIHEESERSGKPIESYDTTLSLVVYNGKRVVYGHSGDGAIIGLTTAGEYVEITSPQKGPDGVSVIPLRFGYSQWNIDTYNEDLAAVILVTDGMRDGVFCPYLLRDHEKGTSNVYVPAATFFCDPNCVDNDASKTIKRFMANDCDSDAFYKQLKTAYEKRTGRKANQILTQIKKENVPMLSMKSVTDDKTVVCIINNNFPIRNAEPKYYQEPDWKILKEVWDEYAYPGLKKHSETDSSCNGKKRFILKRLLFWRNK